MGYDDHFRLSVHAVITDAQDRVLLLQADYGSRGWGLPGGALEPGETVLDALLRECAEELGVEVGVRYLSGIYYHSSHNSHALIFRCELPSGAVIRLSPEHSRWRYLAVDQLPAVQQRRVRECLSYTGTLQSARF